MRTSAVGALVVTVTVGLMAGGCGSEDPAPDPEVAGSSEGTSQVVSSPDTAVQVPPSSHTVTQAEYDRWKTELSNWGRWGPEDELGALNLITPEKRKQAAALVREGVSVSLSRDADLEESPRGAPYQRIMNQVGPTGAADRLTVRYHGYVVTHIDAFGHRFFDGKMWNGFSYEEITEENGAAKNSIHNLKNGIFTRGILMDIPRLKGVAYLEPGTRIYPEDLEAWEAQAGVRVSAGDAVFIRTGRWARIDQLGASGPVPGGEPGLDPSVIPWLKQRDVALLGGEQAQDAARVGDMPGLAVHDFALIALGVHLFDNCRLDAVAEAAAAHGRWEFLLTAAPLAIPGGTGSPLNPIATF